MKSQEIFIKTNNQQHKWICYALQNLRYENTLFQLNPKTSKRRTTLKNQPPYCVILGFVKDTQILRVSFQVIRSDRRKITAILLNARIAPAAEKY